MAQGVDTKIMKSRQFIHSAPFVRGFKEVKNGVPMEYDAYDNMFNSILYEYGRHFAHIYNGKLKNGKAVTLDAILAFQDAQRTGTFIIGAKTNG